MKSRDELVGVPSGFGNAVATPAPCTIPTKAKAKAGTIRPGTSLSTGIEMKGRPSGIEVRSPTVTI